MARLIKYGNVALFEFPKGAINPEFTLDRDGVLWIAGYTEHLFGRNIRCMKRYDIKLIGYRFLGVIGIDSDLVEGVVAICNDIDLNNCALFVRDT